MRREVLVVGYDGAALTDIAGPADVFEGANRAGGGYRVRLAAVGGGFAVTGGLRMEAEDLREVSSDVDTLLVVGGFTFADAARDAELLRHLRRVAGG
ncbi:MAG: AraC family transcriptional regulator, partial [Saccharothrix sp.]|nr:AraC family transcriptional regulator [Saccharothrix sp.]